MNFQPIHRQMESFLALEQRGRWCAVGWWISGIQVVRRARSRSAIRIIERVATCCASGRSDDLLAQERPAPRPDLHARFGGDEFCFAIPDLAECSQAHAVSEQFREASNPDWTAEDRRLAATGPRRRRRRASGSVVSRSALRRAQLAADLIQRADKLICGPKAGAPVIYLVKTRLSMGRWSRRPKCAARRRSRSLASYARPADSPEKTAFLARSAVFALDVIRGERSSGRAPQPVAPATTTKLPQSRRRP